MHKNQKKSKKAESKVNKFAELSFIVSLMLNNTRRLAVMHV
jgi:hypothetical protein